MRSVIRFSLNNKFAIWLMTIIVTVAGLYAGVTMKQETLPNLDIPIVSVTTVYPGAAPEEVADRVTKPIEQRILNLEGVKSVNSRSMENVSSIIVEYDYGQNMDKATSGIRDVLDSVKLPEQAQKSQLSRISLNTFPVLAISIAEKGRSLESLTSLIEERLKPSLEGTTGVASVQVSGQYIKVVELAFKADKMKSLGLTEDTVKGMIQGSALKVPLGLFQLDQSEKAVVVDGNVMNLDDLKRLAIPVMPQAGGQADGSGAPPSAGQAAGQAALPTAQTPSVPGPMAGIPTVELQEIADLNLVGRAESISRTNGAESIGVQIVKAPDANTVDVVNQVKDEIAAFGADNPGVQAVYMMDQGEPIEQSVATMLDKALFGAIFAVIVILLFLRNFRTTIISVISIPLSLLIGILILKQMDVTLNMMTLGALTVAIGRVVDDSIVVIENIYRRMSLRNEKLKGKELILEATKEMFVPIMSSTIVTIAVFLPLATVSGMVGELFMPFALTIVFALLASLLVAITIVPMVGHTMFRNGVNSKRHHDEDKPGKLASAYKKLLNWTLNHKAVTFVSAVVLLGGSLFLVPLIGASFLPEEEQKYAMITYNPAPGERLEDVEQLALKAEPFIMGKEGVTNLQYSVGGSNPLSPGPSKSALFYVQYRSDVKDFGAVKEKLLADIQGEVPGQGKWGTMYFAAGMGGGGKLSLEVYGNSMEDIIPAVEQIRKLVESNPDFAKVDTSVSETYDQYTFVADQKKLSSLGLTAGQIAMALRPAQEQPALTNIMADGKRYEVKVKVQKQRYASIDDLENTPIVSPLGFSVLLKDVADIREGTSPNTISTRDGIMYAEVSAEVKAKDVASASSGLKSDIDALKLPPNIGVKFGGVTEQMQETFSQLGLAMAAAIAIVYLVLVITFGGALAPFAILFSLPFAVIGALVALWAAGETLSVSALMGALMLIGIVVTNAIVLIDRVIQKEKEGVGTREALLNAGVTRLRPILMTALATIGALLPLAFGFESAGVISKGLGVTVIGGLASSTLLTLVIVPVVYEFLMKFRKKTLA